MIGPLPKTVTVVEVGLRDGLQNEARTLSTLDKAELFSGLATTGLGRIEVTSFVSAKWVPQLGDADELLRIIEPPSGMRLTALVPNRYGLERAIAAGLSEVTLVCSASDSHNRANLNQSTEETLTALADVIGRARERGMLVRATISTAFGGPHREEVPHQTVLRIAERYVSLGASEVVLADTVGAATPLQVEKLFQSVAEKVPGVPLAAHFHDTHGVGLTNVVAALGVGVAVFDSSIGGMGGCPYAPGARGNVATEDLVYLLEAMGVATGIDLDALVKVSSLVERLVGHPTDDRAGRALRAERTAAASS